MSVGCRWASNSSARPTPIMPCWTTLNNSTIFWSGVGIRRPFPLDHYRRKPQPVDNSTRSMLHRPVGRVRDCWFGTIRTGAHSGLHHRLSTARSSMVTSDESTWCVWAGFTPDPPGSGAFFAQDSGLRSSTPEPGFRPDPLGADRLPSRDGDVTCICGAMAPPGILGRHSTPGVVRSRSSSHRVRGRSFLR